MRPKAKTWFFAMFIISVTIFMKSIFYLNVFIENTNPNYKNKLEVRIQLFRNFLKGIFWLIWLLLVRTDNYSFIFN